MPFATHPQHRRVVFLLIDGARHDVLRALLAQGDLPNLARWVIEPGGMAVGTTVFPSTTGVAYIPFLFGRYPGPANVPGIRALDRAVANAWHAVAARPWRFLFVVFPGPDGLTHLHHPTHRSVIEAYRHIDRALGEFVMR